MYVVKRDGSEQPVQFDKVTTRLTRLSYGLNKEFCDPVKVAQKVVAGVYTGVTTVELDNLAAETCATMTTKHPGHIFWSSL